MTVIDKRGTPLTTTVGDLAIGKAFTDDDGDINIKIGDSRAIYWYDEQWLDRIIDDNTPIIPLKVTYTFEREGSRNE